MIINNYQILTTTCRKHYFYSFDTVNCKCKALTIKTSNSKTLSIIASCDFYSNHSFLLTVASGRTKFSLQRGKLCVETVKIYPL